MHPVLQKFSETSMTSQLGREAALTLADCQDFNALFTIAATLRDQGHGTVQSYSRKVFIPLTHLCRDVCHYCTFSRKHGAASKPYLDPEEVLEIARAGAAVGCHEALFTLGDKPELRYPEAREALQRLGHKTTLSYLADMCRLVVAETGLLPHVNAGVMSADQMQALRHVSVSQGLMLESASDRLCMRGGPHFGSPDKEPKVRLATIHAAGEARIPFTSGILIGIGETRAERIEALLALRDLHDQFGHLQEIIIQNFRRKPRTRMAQTPEPSALEHLWTIAIARLIFGPVMNVQAPPNLIEADVDELIAAGVNDWGGVSPVTPDHVNPEAPWPHLATLAGEIAKTGKVLVERLSVYPAYAIESAPWLDVALSRRVVDLIDSDGLVRESQWSPGSEAELPVRPPSPHLAAVERNSEPNSRPRRCRRRRFGG